MSFYENWDDSHIYWTTAYRIGPTVSIASRSRDMSHFYAFAGVPVLTLVSRPDAIIDYKVVDPTFTGIVSRLHQDLTLTSVHRYFAPTVGVGYAMGKGSGFRQRLYWRLEYAMAGLAHSKRATAVRHSFSVGLLF